MKNSPPAQITGANVFSVVGAGAGSLGQWDAEGGSEGGGGDCGDAWVHRGDQMQQE